VAEGEEVTEAAAVTAAMKIYKKWMLWLQYTTRVRVRERDGSNDKSNRDRG
jgi:hypothetical protein